jgi:hypothetical protein
LKRRFGKNAKNFPELQQAPGIRDGIANKGLMAAGPTAIVEPE